MMLLVMLRLSGTPAAEQDMISQARQLYYSTYYEEALKVLDGVAAGTVTASQLQMAREYRALCLLALERGPEAEKIIEQMIEADPFYQPAMLSAPPMLLAAFSRTRRHVVPSLARDRYGRAKADFDRHRYAESAAGFEVVLRLIKEAGVAGGDGNGVQLKELERLATQFLSESRAARDRPASESPRVADAKVPPAPSARSVAVPVPGSQGEMDAIRQVIGRYEQSYDKLDAQAVASIWPSVDSRGLARIFSQLQRQDLSFDSCEFDLSGSKATAQCDGWLQYVPRVGNTTPRREHYLWTIRLERAAGIWSIVRVRAR
jgi:tetratricopeptide (TPR) repeat protein